MAAYVLGLDVHSAQSTFVLQREDGTLVDRGSIPTTPEGLRSLRDRHELPPETPVGLETGTVSFYVARQLARLGLRPVVVDAHEVRLKAHRPLQKSDRRDALEICEGVRRGIYRTIVHVPPRTIALLRDSLSRRRHFVRHQTAETNAVKRLLRAAGLYRYAQRGLLTEKGWDRLEAQIGSDEDLIRYVRQHREAWRCAGRQISELDAMLREQQAPVRDQVRRLQTVPGVGPIVALTAIATFSDVRRFPSAKHAASYAGLVPSTHQSGDRNAHGHITKRGSAELRAMLCQAAHQARRPNHPLNPYFAMLCARRGHKMAVVAVAHRLCRILFAMLRHENDFDIQRLGIERGPFEKTLVRLYRRKGALAT